VWIIMPPSMGGLGFTAYEIGIMQAIGGVYGLFLSLIVTPWAIKRFGVKITAATGMIIGAIGSVSIPMAGFLHPDHTSAYITTSISPIVSKGLMWIGIVLVYLQRTTGGTLSAVPLVVVVNNSATRELAASANGLGQSYIAGFRAVIPALAGAVFSLTVTMNLPYPFNYHFAFILNCGLNIFCLILVCFLPKSINERRKEEEEDFSVVENEEEEEMKELKENESDNGNAAASFLGLEDNEEMEITIEPLAATTPANSTSTRDEQRNQ